MTEADRARVVELLARTKEHAERGGSIIAFREACLDLGLWQSKHGALAGLAIAKAKMARYGDPAVKPKPADYPAVIADAIIIAVEETIDEKVPAP